MIVDRILGLETQTVAQSQVRTHAPVILHIQTRVHDIDRNRRYRAYGCARDSVDRELEGLRLEGLWITFTGGLDGLAAIRGQVLECPRAIKTIRGEILVVDEPEPSAESQEMIAERHRSVVLQFVVILIIRRDAAGCTPADEGAGN